MFDFLRPTPKNYESLDGNTFKSKMENTPNAVLLVVRTAGEYAGGTIPGAKNLDVNSREFHTALDSLDKDKEYIVFCRSGNRSGSACCILADKGVKAYNLFGGIGFWPR